MMSKKLIEKLESITSMEELAAFIAENKQKTSEKKRDCWRRVYCLETGKTYNSIGQAAEELGIRNCQSVWQAIIKGGTTNGYHFKYVV